MNLKKCTVYKSLVSTETGNASTVVDEDLFQRQDCLAALDEFCTLPSASDVFFSVSGVKRMRSGSRTGRSKCAFGSHFSDFW